MDKSETAQNFPDIPPQLEAEIFLGPSEDTSSWWWLSLENKIPLPQVWGWYLVKQEYQTRVSLQKLPGLERELRLLVTSNAQPFKKMPTFRKPQKARRSSCRYLVEIWSAQRGKPVVRILVYSSRSCSHMRNMSGKWGGFLPAAVNGLWADPLPLHRASVTVLLPLLVWRWGWSTFCCFSTWERLLASRFPFSLCKISGILGACTWCWAVNSWYLLLSCGSRSWHPAAPPASPIHQ